MNSPDKAPEDFHPMIIVDLETSGVGHKLKLLSGDSDSMVPRIEILEIGALKVHPETLAVLDRFEMKVKPKHPEYISEFAAKLNGYTAQAWADAAELSVALPQFNTFAQGGVFWGDNPTYDYTLLETYNALLEQEMPFHGHRSYCIHDEINGILIGMGKMPNRKSFRSLAESLGVVEDPIHRAINGCVKALATYRAAITTAARHQFGGGPCCGK